MIEFFRDILSGPLYIIVVIISIVFIMAIIGFLMERKKLEKEKRAKIAIVSSEQTVISTEPIGIHKAEEVQSNMPSDLNQNRVVPSIIEINENNQKQ